MLTLGDTAKDQITGLKGLLIGRADHMFGCSRWAVQPQDFKDGKYPEALWFDEYQLEKQKKAGPIATPMPADFGDIELGDEVQDLVTGAKGIVTCMTRWLLRNTDVVMQPQELKDGKPVDALCLHVAQVKITKKQVLDSPNRRALKEEQAQQAVPAPVKRPGGPQKDPTTRMSAKR